MLLLRSISITITNTWIVGIIGQSFQRYIIIKSFAKSIDTHTLAATNVSQGDKRKNFFDPEK